MFSLPSATNWVSDPVHTLPGWVTGALRGSAPIAGAPCTPPSPPFLSQVAPSSLRNTSVHSAAPSKPPLPPRKLPGPVRPGTPRCSTSAPRTSQVSTQPWTLACAPSPRPFLAEAGRAAHRPDPGQAQPFCGRTVRRVTQAGPAPPPSGAATGAVGAVPGSRRDARRA